MPDEPITQVRFEKFHKDNPHIYQMLVKLARDWMDVTGSGRLGIRTLWERMRWELIDAEDYRLDNNYTSFYARMIQAEEPGLEGLFRQRRSPEADQWAWDRYRR